MSASVKISKSARSTSASAKAVRNSCQRFLAAVFLGKSREDNEDCNEVGEGILKLNPSRWAPNMICKQCL